MDKANHSTKKPPAKAQGQTRTTQGHQSDLLRALLQREFGRRSQKNRAYSIRVFAKFLEIDQSLLSKIMRGERKISQDLASRIVSRIGLKPLEIEALGKAPYPALAALEDDRFQLMSEWYHFAILELAKTVDFSPEPRDIARRLGLHVDEVRAAIERLERLGFIETSTQGWTLLSPNNTWTDTRLTTESRRHLQRRLRELGLNAIDHVHFADRDDGSVTVAIDRARLPEIKEKLKDIRRELNAYLSADTKPNEVYQLTISLFPLTRLKGISHDQ